MRTTSPLASFLRWSIFSKMLTIVIIVITLFGTIIHMIEPETFPTIFEGVWWAIVTAATVGYGDFAPVTITGRMIGMLLIFIGVGLVSTYFVTISTSALINQNSYNEGKVSYKGDKHVLIIGWNERVKETISKIAASNINIEIILVDESLKKNPLPTNHVHFIKGNPTHDAVLEKANVKQAEMVLITADQSKDEVQADMITILTLLAIKGLNPEIYCIVEILTTQQINNARRGGADEILQTNRLASFVMVNSITSHGISEALLSLLIGVNGCKLHFIEATFDLFGMSFKTCSEKLLNEGKILIGIKRVDDVIINPPLSLEIRKSDYLLLIKS
ncbi:potassium channel family protein [Ferdinandcohnia quinoae]|uniref:Potassium channel family protein n=1 Tax=Fredinandcohnia quinoae TaxID=2918902 RepID=A0AAW5DXU2_9BACI|nr:potassium channel family protein [Fredinandcohnia sp. SECRCQ15]MCH1625485.1 potassium channel family protein [Fredinandcohnia sp. SECRCQ15]